jgi:hypothetical protein
MSEAKLALAVVRSTALQNYYAAERRAGADPLTANERMHFFAKRLDELEYQRDLAIIKQVMERTS